MTDPYGTVRAQIIDLQGNAIGGQPSINDWHWFTSGVSVTCFIVEICNFLPDFSYVNF